MLTWVRFGDGHVARAAGDVEGRRLARVEAGDRHAAKIERLAELVGEVEFVGGSVAVGPDAELVVAVVVMVEIAIGGGVTLLEPVGRAGEA